MNIGTCCIILFQAYFILHILHMQLYGECKMHLSSFHLQQMLKIKHCFVLYYLIPSIFVCMRIILYDFAISTIFQILHMHLGQVDKLPITTGGSPLQLHCKNFMCITFVIPKERDCHDVYTSLQELSRPGKYNFLSHS